jgi:hypothetical protein
MRYLLLSFCFLTHGLLYSQVEKNRIKEKMDYREKYISLNTLSIAEPQFALGPSFGIRFTKRSEVFAEAAYVAQSPFYGINQYTKLRGARLLLEYRYMFSLHTWPFFSWISPRKGNKSNTFIGVHGMMKPVTFNAKTDFVNNNSADTLQRYPFEANAVTFGAAIVFGGVINLSSDKKWKLELSVGVGGKDRKVRLKSIPDGYKLKEDLGRREWIYIAPLYEESSGVYTPVGIRLRYTFD